ncbi:MAG TPA: 50S ribosomal protein L10 [Bryobacteraceae bacterium]|nr:50S ribosomal protein L10 [Bryobacteraceae bacterium]
MKDREQKEKDLARLREEFERANSIFLTGYEKMTVQQDFDLRKAIRGAGGDYAVIKNTLAEKAAEGKPVKDLMKDLAGMNSMAFTTKDPVALAKALTTYAKANPVFTFKAGFVEGRVINVQGIQDLANLPSKEELISKIMFLINASAQRMAVALNGVSRNVAVVLDQAGKENKFSG